MKKCILVYLFGFCTLATYAMNMPHLDLDNGEALPVSQKQKLKELPTACVIRNKRKHEQIQGDIRDYFEELDAQETAKDLVDTFKNLMTRDYSSKCYMSHECYQEKNKRFLRILKKTILRY